MAPSKKVVIAGSASLQNEIHQWIDYWNTQKGHKVIDFPKFIPQEGFHEIYPKIHHEFFKNLRKANLLFVANENKNGIVGYVGAETFAEAAFVVSENLIDRKKIKVLLRQMPSPKVQSFDEIRLWLKLGWIQIMEK